MSLVVLGGGITGLSAGLTSGAVVYEAQENPGGICSSYYIYPNESRRLDHAPSDGEAYRFELGGGHWLFGKQQSVLNLFDRLTHLEYYARRSSVFLPEDNLYIPYPIQYHLKYLPMDVARSVLKELEQPEDKPIITMDDWLKSNFGSTLYDLFFGPFHELYTAGMASEIAPQDSYKSPVNIEAVRRGMEADAETVGYNVTFAYPRAGLDRLMRRIAERCDIAYDKKVVRIVGDQRRVHFADGTTRAYETALSTIPLNHAVKYSGLNLSVHPDPYVSVLVLNIGAARGPNCPHDHWLYIPTSRSGFHRVGFYSNVDSSFLPRNSREKNSTVSIYVERSYRGGEKPDDREVQRYSDTVVRELQAWDFLGDVEAVDATWIDVAYTWSTPASTWKGQALAALSEFGIRQVGRFAEWQFQGIVESCASGLIAGTAYCLHS